MAIQHRKPVSKFALSDLAFRSALELEQARQGKDFDRALLAKLAAALSNASNPRSEGASFRFVEPGYYEPFERLYKLSHEVDASSVEQIQDFFKVEIRKLEGLSHRPPTSSEAAELVDFCVSLHRELVNALAAETAIAAGEWRGNDNAASNGVSQAESAGLH